MNDEEYKIVSEWLKEISDRAIQETFSQGFPITTIVDDDIVRLYPDGKMEFIKKLEKKRIKVEKRIYHL
jgi:hypothetical protein